MPTILIADDSEDLLEAFVFIFKRRKIDIIAVTDKQSLFEQLKIITPDLIILDVMLKGDDGREICLELKTKMNFQNPIVLMSASAAKLKNHKDFCADEIIEKPFVMQDLLITIRSLLPA